MTVCIECGKELTTNNPFYSHEHRGYLGPKCARKLYAPTVKELNKRAKKYEDLINEIWSADRLKSHNRPRDLPKREEIDIYYVRRIGHVLHPDLFEEIDAESIPVLDPYSNFTGIKFNYNPNKFYIREVDEVQRIVNLNSFLNIFKDPRIGSALDVFNGLGIRLAYHCPVIMDKRERVSVDKEVIKKNKGTVLRTAYGGKSEASFIVTADNSPFPERMMWFRTVLDPLNTEWSMYTVNILNIEPDGKIHCSQAMYLPPIKNVHGPEVKIMNLRSFSRLVDTFFSEKNPYDIWEFYRHTGMWESVSEEAWNDYPIKGPRGPEQGGNTWDTSSAMIYGKINCFGEDIRELEPDAVAKRRGVRKRYND